MSQNSDVGPSFNFMSKNWKILVIFLHFIKLELGTKLKIFIYMFSFSMGNFIFGKLILREIFQMLKSSQPLRFLNFL